MSLPFFYLPDLSEKTIVLDEENSKHIISVLRMATGEELLFTDGKGTKAKARIINDNRKKCIVEISSTQLIPQRKNTVSIGISLIKNISRFEWFLEKATEIGVGEIIPLICERTEKEKFRKDRLHQILISAMLQSQQCHMPLLQEPVAFNKAVELKFEQKFIAHCVDEKKNPLQNQIIAVSSTFIMIGPEGDFTSNEIEMAVNKSFIPVSLGENRLRTETAGIVAVVHLQSLVNQES